MTALSGDNGRFRRHERSVLFLLLIIGAAIIGSFTWQILAATGGLLVYTMDDTYIALAVSESIREGGYGINRGEYVSASSSIIYPLLIAPAADTAFHVWGPLLINSAATALTIIVLVRIASLSGFSTTFLRMAFAGSLIFWCTLYFNVYGVVFTGLEHSLHTAVTAVILAGLITAIQRKNVPWWLVAAIPAATLLRFEGIVASIAALCVLLALGEYRRTFLAAAILGGCLLAYGAVMFSLGLPFLPNPVWAKSGAARSLMNLSVSGVIADATQRLVTYFPHRPAKALLTFGTLAILRPALGALFSWRSFSWRDCLIPFFVVSVTIAHVLGGGFRWLDRYEVYALVTGAVGLLYIYRNELLAVVGAIEDPKRRPFLVAAAITAIALLFYQVRWFGADHFNTTKAVPHAAYNIFEQQFQMHRFARDFYRGPVAVNDLGYVAWRNPHYVLDLVGLGSDEVLRARRTRNFTTEWIDDATRRHDIGVVMIYDWALPTTPPSSWEPLAYLRLGKTPSKAPAGTTVTFYRTPVTSRSSVIAALDQLAGSLPKGVVLDRWPDCGDHATLSELARSVPEGSLNAPDIRRFQCPLSVGLETAMTVKAVTIQSEQHHRYSLRLMKDGRLVGTIVAQPTRVPGLRSRTHQTEPVVADTIVIDPLGAPHFSLGQLQIISAD